MKFWARAARYTGLLYVVLLALGFGLLAFLLTQL